MAVAGKSDPCLSAQPREEMMDCPQASSSCGEMMERVSPVLPTLFEDPLAGEEDNEDEVFSAILKDEGDNDEDIILPPIQSSPPSAQDASSPSPVQTDTDLLEDSRRAAARLSIDWPSQPAGQGAEKDLYDGKRLQSRLPPARQFIPAIPACGRNDEVLGQTFFPLCTCQGLLEAGFLGYGGCRVGGLSPCRIICG